MSCPRVSADYLKRLLDVWQPDKETVSTSHTDLLREALSEREQEVLRLIALGLTNREAAERLIVAPSTIKKHLDHIYLKLGVNRRTQAIAYARQRGIIS
jgi:LuxR family maltose regulon positive regulatory protein